MKTTNIIAAGITQHQQRCNRLVAAFRFAEAIASPFKRRLFLNLIAAAHDLPRSECRKLFDIWLAEAENSKNS